MTVLTRSDTIESWLKLYSRILKWDYELYRQHVFRQVNLSLHFLNDNHLLRPEIEFCAVHHDLGLWLEGDGDILMTSLKKALEQNMDHTLGFDPALIKDVIFHHTKVFAFQGPNSPVVNAFRKAHWVELTKGKLKKGVDPAFLEALYQDWPLIDVLEFKGKHLKKKGEKDPLKAIGGLLKLVKF